MQTFCTALVSGFSRESQFGISEAPMRAWSCTRVRRTGAESDVSSSPSRLIVVPFSTDLYSGRHTVHRTASYPRTMTVSDGSGLAARRRSTVPGDAKPEPEKRTLLHTADPAAYLGKPSVHSLYQRLKISVLAVYRKVVPGVRKGRRRGDESGYARTCDSDCIRGFPGIMHSRPGAARRPGLRPALGCVAERPFA